MFPPKQVPLVSSIEQSSAPLSSQTENESPAATSSDTAVRPAPLTTTRVSSDFTRSLPGSARCSHAIRPAPKITPSTATATMYHHRLFWTNATVGDPDELTAGAIAVTSPTAADTMIVATRTTPIRSTCLWPSCLWPRPIRTPATINDSTQMPNAIHVAHPRTVLIPPTSAA